MDPVINTFGLEPMSSTVSGPNVAATLAQYVSPHGTRAFIITDAGVNGAGIVKPITDALTTAGMMPIASRRNAAGILPCVGKASHSFCKVANSAESLRLVSC